jgi:DNA-binding NarL/FixJ family response regulator
VSLKIFIADDHEVVRQGLRALLSARSESGGAATGWTVCGEAADGRQAVEGVLASRPDVVVMDVAMPHLNGLEATRRIVAESPRAAVLILSATESEELVREVLTAGARGFLLKTDAGKDLRAAVSELSQGRAFFSARVADMVLKGYLEGGNGKRAFTTPASTLTTREREVLQLLAEGQGNKQVAAALGIGIKTAEAHRANLMRKLSVRSMSELVRYAIRNKMVEP